MQHTLNLSIRIQYPWITHKQEINGNLWLTKGMIFLHLFSYNFPQDSSTLVFHFGKTNWQII